VSEQLKQPELFDTKPFRTERLPQRFAFEDAGRVRFGVCWPKPDGDWQVDAWFGVATFETDPWEVLGQLLQTPDVGESVAWIDNDFGWHGRSYAELKADRQRRAQPRPSRIEQLIKAVNDRIQAGLPEEYEIRLVLAPDTEPMLELVALDGGRRELFSRQPASSDSLRALIDKACAGDVADDDYDDEDDEF